MRDLAACLWIAVAAILCVAQDAAPEASVGGPVSPSGVAAQAPLPKDLHMRNRGGNDRTRTNPLGLPGKGSGLCVFTSIEHASRWQNAPALDGLQEWMTRQPGGGHPAKVDAMLKRFCAEKGRTIPPYLQVEGDDLAILELALKTGRLACVTYGISPTRRYAGEWIDHMVNCSHAKGDEFAVIDNNYPGSWEWMTRAEFSRAFSSKGRPRPPGRPPERGWMIVFLDPPAPPAPLDPVPEPK